jgi:DNA-binding response OmpR family regulator
MTAPTVNRVTAGPLTTLLVDDEKSFGLGLVELLDDYGFQAEFVTSAEEAEPLTEEHDVVVVDLNLPSMSGRELAERIQISHPAKWMLLLTARKVLKEEMERSGTVSYLKLFDKPLVGDALDDFLRTLAELRDRKESTANMLNRLLIELETAGNIKLPLLDRQEVFVNAKMLVRREIQDRFRKRSESRRQIALMLRVAMDRLSLVPSEQFNLIYPTELHFNVLKDVVLRLGKERISAEDEYATDRQLDAVGLSVGLEVPDPSAFFHY